MISTEEQAIQKKVKKLFQDYLEKKGLRKTSERFIILEEIYNLDHFDSQKLYERMIHRNYRVSRATVYNTLDLLMECGLVVKHQFGDNLSVYEKSYHYKQHDHLICLDCKKIFEFCDPRIQNTKNLVENVYKTRIQRHSMTFYGNCSDSDCPHYPQPEVMDRSNAEEPDIL